MIKSKPTNKILNMVSNITERRKSIAMVISGRHDQKIQQVINEVYLVQQEGKIIHTIDHKQILLRIRIKHAYITLPKHNIFHGSLDILLPSRLPRDKAYNHNCSKANHPCKLLHKIM